MFSTKLIIIAFLIMGLSMLSLEWLDEKKLQFLKMPMIIIALILSIYCICAGIYTLIGWQDPIAAADPEVIQNIRYQIRSGGAFLMFLQFWPFILIGISGLVAYFSSKILLEEIKERNQ